MVRSTKTLGERCAEQENGASKVILVMAVLIFLFMLAAAVSQCYSYCKKLDAQVAKLEVEQQEMKSKIDMYSMKPDTEQQQVTVDKKAKTRHRRYIRERNSRHISAELAEFSKQLQNYLKQRNARYRATNATAESGMKMERSDQDARDALIDTISRLLLEGELRSGHDSYTEENTPPYHRDANVVIPKLSPETAKSAENKREEELPDTSDLSFQNKGAARKMTEKTSGTSITADTHVDNRKEKRVSTSIASLINATERADTLAKDATTSGPVRVFSRIHDVQKAMAQRNKHNATNASAKVEATLQLDLTNLQNKRATEKLDSYPIQNHHTSRADQIIYKTRTPGLATTTSEASASQSMSDRVRSSSTRTESTIKSHYSRSSEPGEGKNNRRGGVTHTDSVISTSMKAISVGRSSQHRSLRPGAAYDASLHQEEPVTSQVADKLRPASLDHSQRQNQEPSTSHRVTEVTSTEPPNKTGVLLTTTTTKFSPVVALPEGYLTKNKTSSLSPRKSLTHTIKPFKSTREASPTETSRKFDKDVITSHTAFSPSKYHRKSVAIQSSKLPPNTNTLQTKVQSAMISSSRLSQQQQQQQLFSQGTSLTSIKNKHTNATVESQYSQRPQLKTTDSIINLKKSTRSQKMVISHTAAVLNSTSTHVHNTTHILTHNDRKTERGPHRSASRTYIESKQRESTNVLSNVTMTIPSNSIPQIKNNTLSPRSTHKSTNTITFTPSSIKTDHQQTVVHSTYGLSNSSNKQSWSHHSSHQETRTTNIAVSSSMIQNMSHNTIFSSTTNIRTDSLVTYTIKPFSSAQYNISRTVSITASAHSKHWNISSSARPSNFSISTHITTSVNRSSTQPHRTTTAMPSKYWSSIHDSVDLSSRTKHISTRHSKIVLSVTPTLRSSSNRERSPANATAMTLPASPQNTETFARNQQDSSHTGVENSTPTRAFHTTEQAISTASCHCSDVLPTMRRGSSRSLRWEHREILRSTTSSSVMYHSISPASKPPPTQPTTTDTSDKQVILEETLRLLSEIMYITTKGQSQTRAKLATTRNPRSRRPTQPLPNNTMDDDETMDAQTKENEESDTNEDYQIVRPFNWVVKRATGQSNSSIINILNDNNRQENTSAVEPKVVNFLQMLLKKLQAAENKTVDQDRSNGSLSLKWECNQMYTKWNTAYIIGMSKFLQSHDVKCGVNKFLKSFKLQDNQDNFFPLFRYEYVCCALTLHQQR